MEKKKVKEYLKKQYPNFKGFIEHTLVAEMAINFSNMQLKDINNTLCCTEVETVEVDKEITKSITKLMRSDQFKNPKKKRF